MTFVRVRQRLGGIPVLGADATLTLGADGDRLLLDHTWAAVAQPAPARISRAEAIRRARGYVHLRALRAPVSASKVILPQRRRLAWRVLVPGARPLGDFEALVDARSGALVRLRNLVKDATTTPALVFDPNPVVEQGSRTGLADDNNGESAALEPLYRKVTLRISSRRAAWSACG